MEFHSPSSDLEEKATARSEDDSSAYLHVHTHLEKELADERRKMQEDLNERREKTDRSEKEVHFISCFYDDC